MPPPDGNFAWLLRRTVADRETEFTCGGLAGRAGAFAGAPIAAGIRPGDRLAWLQERGLDAAAAPFGALAAGAVAVKSTLPGYRRDRPGRCPKAAPLVTGRAVPGFRGPPLSGEGPRLVPRCPGGGRPPGARWPPHRLDRQALVGAPVARGDGRARHAGPRRPSRVEVGHHSRASSVWIHPLRDGQVVEYGG